MKKKVFALAAGVAILAGACATSNKTVSQADLTGEWKIIELNDSVLPAQPEEPYMITFETTDSMFSAQTGCNIVGGKFVMAKDNGISFGNMMSTRMMCPDMFVEEALMKVLPNVTTVEQGQDGSLVFYDAAHAGLLTLKK